MDLDFVGPEDYIILRALFMKRYTESRNQIRYESEYSFRAPPGALEGARASKGP